MHQKEVEGDGELIARVNQWHAAWGKDRPIFSRRDKKTTPYTNPVATKKTLTCYLCGKVGHTIRECRGKREEEVDGPSKKDVRPTERKIARWSSAIVVRNWGISPRPVQKPNLWL